jgi:hypothetical protein
MKFKNFAVCISWFSALFFLSCSNKKTDDETVLDATRTSITFIQPVMQGFTDDIQLNGNTQFQKKLVVRANITGYITAMPWKTGVLK